MEDENIWQLPKINRNMTGQYSCTASNACGSDRRNVDIDVQCESISALKRILQAVICMSWALIDHIYQFLFILCPKEGKVYNVTTKNFSYVDDFVAFCLRVRSTCKTIALAFNSNCWDWESDWSLASKERIIKDFLITFEQPLLKHWRVHNTSASVFPLGIHKNCSGMGKVYYFSAFTILLLQLWLLVKISQLYCSDLYMKRK